MTDKIDVFDQGGRKVGEARLSEEALIDRAAVGASAGVLGAALLAIVGIFVLALGVIFAAFRFVQFALREPGHAMGAVFVVLSCTVAVIGSLGVSAIGTLGPMWYFFGLEDPPKVVTLLAAPAVLIIWVVTLVLWLKAMAPLHRRFGRALKDDPAYWG